jgi:hypothetical protein
VKRALGLGAGLAAIALVVGAVQGGTDPAPVAAALGQAGPVTTAPVATTVPAPAPSTTAAPSSTVHNVPGRAKDAPTTTSRAQAPTDFAYFPSCAKARAAGAAPLHRGDSGYRSGLDRDGDGIACETT